jgi:hypothetical protein
MREYSDQRLVRLRPIADGDVEVLAGPVPRGLGQDYLTPATRRTDLDETGFLKGLALLRAETWLELGHHGLLARKKEAEQHEGLLRIRRGHGRQVALSAVRGALWDPRRRKWTTSRILSTAISRSSRTWSCGKRSTRYPLMSSS